MCKRKFLFCVGVACALTLFLCIQSTAQIASCEAKIEGDVLILKNKMIEQQWSWNNGDIKPLSIRNQETSKEIRFNGRRPAFFEAENTFKKNIAFDVEKVKGSFAFPEHVQVTVENEYENLQLKRVFRIFPNTPAIACEFYLKYDELRSQKAVTENQATGAESTVNIKKVDKNYLLSYPLPGKHWQVKTVAFFDVTDHNDNLVFETSSIPYKKTEKSKGSLLLASDLQSQAGFFLLKEAPLAEHQVAYPGFDYGVNSNEVQVPFSGFPAKSIHEGWTKGYTLTTGVCDQETQGLKALRAYLKNTINYSADRYDMVMMNTWGDRGQDGKISEKFILEELEAASDLGISVFQIDDGWQQGLSKNSAFKGKGNSWDSWATDSWQPNKERFPNGLKEVIKSAKKKNIQLGLWFNPSKRDSYARWKEDADVIIGLHKQTGIKYFKIDGVAIPDKLAEENFSNFINRIKEGTNGEVFFNLDLTAGVRGGYFSFRSAGNLFLENRYTDWGNYYPFHTLRNLWMLSKYFPPELMQIEFLNKWRNAKKYGNDIFAPSKYDFEYLFAGTMAAQPLAWFESTGLPEEAKPVSSAIKSYREIQSDLHAGTTLPIGNEPSGRSWTGFQSMKGNKGYFIVYREKNDKTSYEMETWLKEGQHVKLSCILGAGKDFETKTMQDGRIRFSLPNENSYALYQYEIQ